MRQVLLSTLAIILIVGMSPAYALSHIVAEVRANEPQVEPQDFGTPLTTPGFFLQIQFFIQDRLESIFPDLRTSFGESARQSILEDLAKGLTVAQERIDRVGDRLGIESIREIANVNQINRVYQEFLEIRAITDSETQRIEALNFDRKVNQMEIVKLGCEKPINTMEILDSVNYYETLRTDFCSKTLKNIDIEKAKGYLGY